MKPAQYTPRVANRTARIEPFKVMELVKQAHALQAQGKPIIHLSIGEPDFGAPQPVRAALQHALDEGDFPYTQATGLLNLREAISNYYLTRFGVQVDPNRIIVTAGASAALTLACAALVNPGDGVLMTDPGYPCNRHFVSAFDGVPKLVVCDASTRFQMTADALAKHWAGDDVGTLIASPSNPTGTSIAWDELCKIMDVVRARKGFAIVDEIYLELTYGKKPRTVLELGDDMIVSNSFSKYFNMTGWRLGWLVVPPTLVSTFEKLSQNLYICPSTLAQRAALTCFTEESLALFDDRKQIFAQRRDYIVPALQAIGLEIPVIPDGAFYAWLDVSKMGIGASALAHRLLHEAHISVVPGEDFGHHRADDFIRLSYATSMPQLEEAVGRLKNFFNAMNPK